MINLIWGQNSFEAMHLVGDLQHDKYAERYHFPQKVTIKKYV